jgi:hypothetical protein
MHIQKETKGEKGRAALAVEAGAFGLRSLRYLLFKFWGDWVVGKRLLQKETKETKGEKGRAALAVDRCFWPSFPSLSSVQFLERLGR